MAELTNIVKKELEKDFIDHKHIEKQFIEAFKITGKSPINIIKYYLTCKNKLDSSEYVKKHFNVIREEINMIYTEVEYDEHIYHIEEEAMAFTRDYVWFDEKMD